MTRRLILMRHAKSDWDDPLLSDHARPLNARGRASASAIGDWLRARGDQPDQVLCSSATRTQETFTLLGVEAPLTLMRQLYLASPDVMLAALRGATGGCVLMLGHNPGIAELAEHLLDRAPDHPRFHDYPTCSTLIADFDILSWRDLRPGTGTARAFITPRELTEA